MSPFSGSVALGELTLIQKRSLKLFNFKLNFASLKEIEHEMELHCITYSRPLSDVAIACNLAPFVV